MNTRIKKLIFCGTWAFLSPFSFAQSVPMGNMNEAGMSLMEESSGTNVVLTWSVGTLLQSTNASGPWTVVNGAASPYTVPATNAAEFYKIRVTY